MSTQRQIQANRLNAQKSTGPRTPQGKAVSSQNALQSGLDAEAQFVFGEDRDDFRALQHEYAARFQPLTPDERFQVDTLIRSEWLLRRLFRVEAHLWEFHTLRASRSEGVPLGESFATASPVFMRLQRRVTLTERSYKDASVELQRLQAARQTAPPDPQPQPTTEQTAQLASFRNIPSPLLPESAAASCQPLTPT
jgi:hypothetical protein